MNKPRPLAFSIVYLLICLPFLGISLTAVNISDSPYGVNVHLSADAVLGKANSIGIKWIRVDIIWRDIEVNNLNYLYGSVDRVINYAHKNGLSILGVMAYSPVWTNASKKYTLPPDDVALWRRFVEKTVNRYKDRVKYWSIWNEPNLDLFFSAGKDVFVSKIFVPAAQVIKAVDPGAFIVGPDLAHKTSQGQEWYFWLKYILDNAGQYIDVIAHHIYNDQSVVYLFELLEKGDTLIPSVNKIVEEAGHGHKPFWLTETGWSTYKVSEEVQADRYLEFLQRMRLKGFPHKIFFYEMIDDPNTAVEPFGILRASRSEKPAFRVYADFIAGVYPPFDLDDLPAESKKCYAEDSVSNRGDASLQQNMLGRLSSMRADMIQQLPLGTELVRTYYRHSDEFAALARTDARINRLGQDLLLALNDAWNEGDVHNLEGIQTYISAAAKELMQVLSQKKVSPEFRRVLSWCEKQLRLIDQDGLDIYKGLYLPLQTEHIRK